MKIDNKKKSFEMTLYHLKRFYFILKYIVFCFSQTLKISCLIVETNILLLNALANQIGDIN